MKSAHIFNLKYTNFRLMLLSTIVNSFQINTILQFTCEFNKRTLRYFTDVDCCNIKENIHIVQENIELQSSQIYQNIPAFSAYRKQIYYFPKGIENNFPNIEFLEIIGSNLSKITSANLQFLFNLRYFDLSDNNIQNLHENLFQYNPRLEVVILNKNMIKTVHPTAFNNLNLIKFLGFEDNRCFSNMSEYSENVRFLIEDIKYSCSETYNRLEENMYKIHMTVEKWNTMQSNLASKVLENSNKISELYLKHSRALDDYKLEINKIIKDSVLNNSGLSSINALNSTIQYILNNSSQQQNDTMIQNEIQFGYLNLNQTQLILFLIISNISQIILFCGIIIYLCCTRKPQNKVSITKQLRIQPLTYRHLLESPLATPSNLNQDTIYGQYECIDENIPGSPAFEDFYAEATQLVRNERVNDGSEGYAVVYRPERY